MTLAVGNIVGVRITGNPAVAPPDGQAQLLQPTALQAQPPTFGNVLTFDAGPPLSIRVAWDNTREATIEAPTLADTGLDRITNGDEAEVERLLGGQAFAPRAAPRWVRHKNPVGELGNLTNDPSGGTSRSFDGTVVAVYRRTPVEEDDPSVGPTFCCIRTQSGLYFEDVSSEFVVDDTR